MIDKVKSVADKLKSVEENLVTTASYTVFGV